MEHIARYTNGNTTVTLLGDGTKIREYEGTPEILHPESIDIKISDYCDLGCTYCHESSTVNGTHADLDRLLEVISCLPAGVELAIGGGNPLSHPGLTGFLQTLKSRGIIANLTVNQGHLKPYRDMLTCLIEEELVRGVGISITSNNFTHIKPLLDMSGNIVYHLIAGVNKVETIDSLIGLGYCKVLVLGYKMFGFGVNHHNSQVDAELKRWYKKLPGYIGKCTLSFDNLAIEQLRIKRLFTHEGWGRFYMGDDGQFTCYFNGVDMYFSETSRSHNKYFIKNGYNLLSFFNEIRKYNI